MVVYVDGMMRPVPVLAEVEKIRSETPEPSGLTAVDNAIDIYDGDTSTEDDSLILSAECRICQEESDINNLESPCACNGSLKVVFFFSFASFIAHTMKLQFIQEIGEKTLSIESNFMVLSSMLTGNVFNVGAMKRETLYAKSVIRYIYIYTAFLSTLSAFCCNL